MNYLLMRDGKVVASYDEIYKNHVRELSNLLNLDIIEVNSMIDESLVDEKQVYRVAFDLFDHNEPNYELKVIGLNVCQLRQVNETPFNSYQYVIASSFEEAIELGKKKVVEKPKKYIDNLNKSVKADE